MYADIHTHTHKQQLNHIVKQKTIILISSHIYSTHSNLFLLTNIAHNSVIQYAWLRQYFSNKTVKRWTFITRWIFSSPIFRRPKIRINIFTLIRVIITHTHTRTRQFRYLKTKTYFLVKCISLNITLYPCEIPNNRDCTL